MNIIHSFTDPTFISNGSGEGTCQLVVVEEDHQPEQYYENNAYGHYAEIVEEEGSQI